MEVKVLYILQKGSV